jgi:hemoglobin
MKQARLIHTHTALSIVFLILALGGCATPPPPQPAPGTSLYQRFGGRPAIAALVNDAVINIVADPRINQRFRNADAHHLKSNLVDLLCLRAGGPCTYAGRNMADAHEAMHIRDDEFDALVDDIAKSLDKLKVPATERGEALAILNQMKGAIVGH